MRRILLTSLLILALLLLALPAGQPAHAQAPSAYDLIAAVNELRAANGLPAYEIAADLMGYAQGHSDYMASSGNITHTRADGSMPHDYGFIENIAGGTNLSISTTVYEFWADALHWNTMVGVASGTVGAGVSTNGDWIYYTLDVRRTGAGAGTGYTPPAATSGAPAATYAPITIYTTTPLPDGSIVHEVQSGQTLWGIATAYGVKINDILGLNQLPTTAVINPGQRLVIQPSHTPSPSPTITETPLPATRAPPRPPPPRPPPPTRTPPPSPTPTVFSLLENIAPADSGGARQIIGYTLIGLCGLGLVALLLSGLRKK